MKKRFIVFVLIIICDFAQGCDAPPSAGIDENLRDKYSSLLLEPRQKAVFFAVCHGIDDDIVNALLKVSCQHAMSLEFSKFMVQEVARVRKAHSPVILEMQERINSGSTKACERESLRKRRRDEI